ncbi:MAG: hypothetical protein KIT48_09050 [Pseudolabrys sp.]|nr:hypothetical protein [Pseudolabrys sp.]
MSNEVEHPSDKRRLANRANAQSSTGPRTSAGKRRSSKNALRHGLSGAQVMLHQEIAQDWGEKIARSLNQSSNEAIAAAAAIASAQFDLVRARQARFAVTNIRLTVGVSGSSADTNILQELRFDRYERRAMSRRKKAIAQLMALLARNSEAEG